MISQVFQDFLLSIKDHHWASRVLGRSFTLHNAAFRITSSYQVPGLHIWSSILFQFRRFGNLYSWSLWTSWYWSMRTSPIFSRSPHSRCSLQDFVSWFLWSKALPQTCLIFQGFLNSHLRPVIEAFFLLDSFLLGSLNTQVKHFMLIALTDRIEEARSIRTIFQDRFERSSLGLKSGHLFSFFS